MAGIVWRKRENQSRRQRFRIQRQGAVKFRVGCENSYGGNRVRVGLGAIRVTW